MSRLPLATLLTFALLLVACGESSDVQFTIETRDGVPHAINRGTNVWSDSAKAPIRLTREQTYGTRDGPEETLLGNIRGVNVDSKGIVYVLDEGNSRLVAFNPNGSVRWSNGRQGEGPGEFNTPIGMVLADSGRIFVADQVGRSVDVWSTDGEFLEQHSLAEQDIGPVNLIGYAEGYLIASETGFGSEPQKIHALNPETASIVHSFPLNTNVDVPERMGMSVSVTTVGDTVYVSGIDEYSLQQFTVEGTPVRRTSRSADSLKGLGVYESGSSARMRVYSRVWSPIRLSSGHLLVTAFWPTNVDDPDAHVRRLENSNAEEAVFATVLDLFAPNGRYMGSLRWSDRRTPPFGRLVATDANGKLYTTTSDPFPQVRRYNVTITEP